jgi:toxin-antitoxin system PIN domain toxin
VIALDTNILVYAHREDSPWHAAAFEAVASIAEASRPWAIPAPCLHEFLAIVTHPRIYRPPTPLGNAIDQIDAWRESPSLVILGETEGYWDRLRVMLVAARVQGPQVHDARVAALCLHHDVDELWTADRDFSRFPDLRLRNPLIGNAVAGDTPQE